MAKTRGNIILAMTSILFARDLNFCESQKDGLKLDRFLDELMLFRLGLNAIEFSIHSARFILLSVSNPLLISK